MAGHWYRSEKPCVLVPCVQGANEGTATPLLVPCVQGANEGIATPSSGNIAVADY
jgi:hypothetical protein